MSAELKAIELKAVAVAAGVTANTTGTTAFDLRPYDGEVRFALNANIVGGTSPTLDVKIQHSDNGTSGWVDAGVAFPQISGAAGTGQFLAVTSTAERFKRFIRIIDTVGGTTPSFGRSVTVVAKRRA